MLALSLPSCKLDMSHDVSTKFMGSSLNGMVSLEFGVLASGSRLSAMTRREAEAVVVVVGISLGSLGSSCLLC